MLNEIDHADHLRDFASWLASRSGYFDMSSASFCIVGELEEWPDRKRTGNCLWGSDLVKEFGMSDDAASSLYLARGAHKCHHNITRAEAVRALRNVATGMTDGEEIWGQA